MGMMERIEPSLAVLDLDRRVSRALEQDRGMKFSAEELAILASTGAYGALRAAAGQVLEEQAKCRVKKNSTSAEPFRSAGTRHGMGRSEAHSSPSSGMIRSAAGSEALRRAQSSLILRS